MRVRVVVDVRVREPVPVLVPVLELVRSLVALPETVGVDALVVAEALEACAVALLLGVPVRVSALLPDALELPVTETVALDVPVGLADGGGSLAEELWLSALVCDGSTLTLLRDPAALALGELV